MKHFSSGRRQFIRSSGLAMAGLSILPYCTGADSDKKYGLQLYTLRDLLSQDLKGTLERVAKTGYKELEIFGYGDGKVLGVAPKDLRTLVEDMGMRLVSGHYMTGIAVVTGQGTLTNGWEKAVEDADIMGLDYMVCAYLVPEERQTLDDYKRIADLLSESGLVARQYGIQFGYHNHDFEFQKMEGELPMHTLLDATDDDLVIAELDLYWITRAGYNAIDFFKKYPKRTSLWHVKDIANTEEREFTEVGNGVIDFKAIFAQASLSGMKHFFVEQDVSKRSPLESIEISYRNLKNWEI